MYNVYTATSMVIYDVSMCTSRVKSMQSPLYRNWIIIYTYIYMKRDTIPSYERYKISRILYEFISSFLQITWLLHFTLNIPRNNSTVFVSNMMWINMVKRNSLQRWSLLLFHTRLATKSIDITQGPMECEILSVALWWTNALPIGKRITCVSLTCDETVELFNGIELKLIQQHTWSFKTLILPRFLLNFSIYTGSRNVLFVCHRFIRRQRIKLNANIPYQWWGLIQSLFFQICKCASVHIIIWFDTHFTAWYLPRDSKDSKNV